MSKKEQKLLKIMHVYKQNKLDHRICEARVKNTAPSDRIFSITISYMCMGNRTSS